MHHWRPQHPGILVLIHTHEEHLKKKHAEKHGPYKAKHDYHAAFWGFAGIPLSTIAGITIGKLIEKRKAAS